MAAACTAATGGAAPAAEQAEQRSRETKGVQRKKKRGKGIQGPVCKIRNYRDSSVIWFFSTDLGVFREKIPK
jgi:hypothetical protein